MNSPSHRENIVNTKYREMGIAVSDGVLNGQSTTLVVQMFGSTEGLASLQNTSSTKKLEIDQTPLVASLNTQKTLIDPFKVSKSIGLSIISLLAILLLIDLIVLRRRGILRIQSHHIAHMVVLSTAAAALISSGSGRIL